MFAKTATSSIARSVVAGSSKRALSTVAVSTPSTAARFAVRSTVSTPSVARVAGVQGQKRGYHEKVIDHYTSPRNVGSLDKNNENVGTGLVGAPACGDVMKLQILVGPDNKIQDVKMKVFGCGSAIASSSYLTERVKGMSLEDAGQIKNTEIAKELCLPPVKLHCSMLAEDAIKSAIKDFQSKRSKKNASAAASAPSAESQSNVAHA